VPSQRAAPQRVRVLQSFSNPRPTTNPYIVMLGQCLEQTEGVELLRFSWRRALLGRYDVFHAHWPEILVTGRTALRTLARQTLFSALLLRLWITRTPYVRTMHNLELPQGISRREVFLLRIADRRTTLRIALNPFSVAADGDHWVVIAHGHYRSWYAGHHEPASLPGRVSFFGLVRRYKCVDDLVRAFGDISLGSGPFTLRVAGRPSSQELADELRGLARDDSRVSFHFDFLDDAELVDEVGRAELIVLPYREMHNSGGVLTALSLDRPVLVPDNAVNQALREEVGGHWVQLFSGELSAEWITATVARVRADPAPDPPDLSMRDWDTAGPAHLGAYRTAIDIAHAQGLVSRSR
jgi:beta-1,4-mannosyltransferase